MTRTVFAALVAVVGLLGLALRLAPLPERHLAPQIRDLGASRWVVDDPGTALHLRRIELALAEGRVPQHDPLLAHADRAEIPALPVFDALLAGVAERWLAHEGGDPSLAGVDEPDLEAFAAWVGPVAYLFGFAALLWAAWISARGAYVPVVLAGALVALAPAAVAATEVGRLDTAAFVLVLLALLVRGTQVAVRAGDALSTILEALLCGVLAGLLTSMTAAGPLLALPTGAALLLRALRGPAEIRPIAVRAGLLFALVAAFVARLPLADGPWEHLPDGLVARWALFASDVLLVSAAPFALLLLTAPRDAARKTRSFARLAALAAMLALLVFEVPRAWASASGPIGAWWTARAIAPDEVGLDLAYAVTLSAALGLALACALALRTREPAAVHLALLAGVTGMLALAERDFAPLFVAASACAVAGALPALSAPGRRSVPTALFAFALLPGLILPVAFRRSANERELVLEFVTALRWIRAEVPSGGPFNSSSSRSTWGILATPAMGELVAYHARRPVLASSSAALSHPDLVREARHLAHRATPEEIVGRMRAHGLTLAISSGLYTPFERGDDPNEPRGLATWSGLDLDLPGATRILRSDGRVEISFYASWPVAVVWSLEGVPQPRTPSLIAPR